MAMSSWNAVLYQITNTVRVRTFSHEDSVTLANHQALVPDETDDMGFWSFMKEHKRFWLLPMIIVVLFVVSLVVSGQLNLAPSMLMEEDTVVLF